MLGLKLIHVSKSGHRSLADMPLIIWDTIFFHYLSLYCEMTWNVITYWEFFTKIILLFHLLLRLEYSKKSGSVPWLLMPWLFASPGHWKSWYQVYMMVRTLSSIRTDFNHLYLCNMEEWFKMHISIDDSSQKSNWMYLLLNHQIKLIS